MDVQWCEFFAGEGQVSLALWSCNLKGSSHDLRYSKLMDLCTDHGFAHLGCIHAACKTVTRSAGVSILIYIYMFGSLNHPIYLAVPIYLRLAINELWNLTPGALVLIGICCNSFTTMQPGLQLIELKLVMCIYSVYIYMYMCVCVNWIFSVPDRSSHTAGRDVLNGFLGNTGYKFVQLGNLLASRVVLMILICCAKQARWLVEQPDGSSLASHPRFQELLALVRATWLYTYTYMHVHQCMCEFKYVNLKNI